MLYILIYMLFVVDLYLKIKLIEVRMPWLLHGCGNLLYYNRFFEILFVYYIAISDDLLNKMRHLKLKWMIVNGHNHLG